MKKIRAKKAEFDISTVVSDKTKLTQLVGFIDEAVLSKKKIASENEQIKDIRDEAVNVLGVPPKLFNKIVKAKFKDDFQSEKKDFELFEETMGIIGED